MTRGRIETGETRTHQYYGTPNVLGVAKWPNTLGSASALRIRASQSKRPAANREVRHERLSGFKLVEALGLSGVRATLGDREQPAESQLSG